MGRQGRQPGVETLVMEGREGSTSPRGNRQSRQGRKPARHPTAEGVGRADVAGEAGARRISVRVWLGCSRAQKPRDGAA